MKVIEGLKIGNECLNKMHQVRVARLAERSVALNSTGSLDVSLQASLTHGFLALFLRLCQ